MMSDKSKCLSFFSVCNVMQRNEHIKHTLTLIRKRYDFCGKSGISITGRTEMPGSPHSLDDDVPECDFCLWLIGFADADKLNRDKTEKKLAEVSYRCGILFFSAPGLGRSVSEMVLRHTRYEHAIDIGIAGGHNVFMCW